MIDPIFSVEDKVCFVTGASTGIGGHLARTLLSRGAKVVGIARTDIDWDAGVFNDRFDNLFGDLTDIQAIEDAFSHIKKRYGRVDVVINNAGISKVERAMDISLESFRDTLNINVMAAGIVANRGAEIMRDTGTGGSIINVTSVMANASVTGLGAYSASKAALEQLTKCMAAEWARYSIRVNSLAPGWFPTAMTDGHFQKGLSSVLKARIPLNRLGAPPELDGALLLLASDASRYITGSTITVDGGYSVIN